MSHHVMVAYRDSDIGDHIWYGTFSSCERLRSLVVPLDSNLRRMHQFVATNEGIHFFEVSAMIIGILKEAAKMQCSTLSQH